MDSDKSLAVTLVDRTLTALGGFEASMSDPLHAAELTAAMYIRLLRAVSENV